ncbi:MAG: YggS family pyridoxal phosphate-dependent enzyme [Mycobacterium sp.]
MTEQAARGAQLAQGLAAARQRLAAAAENAGRRPDDIALLPITKFFPATDVEILTALGCRAFGESREQEASGKISAVAASVGEVSAELQWHMVGQIQRNKARAIAAWAHTAHSVSSAKVVTALDRAAGELLESGDRAAPLHIYIQLSYDGDTSRGGVDIGDAAAVDEICAQVAQSEALHLAGVMGVPPLGTDPDAVFARFAQEHRRVLENHPDATGLSAGMSDDLEIAVKHGSTCVRVGTAIMGPRPLTSP